jgi:hypothetical protein
MPMEAGTKLDEAIAEKVLGWEKSPSGWRDPRQGKELPLPAFSTDIAAAFQLVDLVCDAGFRLRIEGKKIWNARFYKSASHSLETHAYPATGSTPAEAIALAALALKTA